MCGYCNPQREYIRLFDVTEKTGVRRHSTSRNCHCCGKSLKDTIVHFGEKGGMKSPYRWKEAARAANTSDVILCLGTSLKVSCYTGQEAIIRCHYTPRNKVRGYTGITMSVCPSVHPSVCPSVCPAAFGFPAHNCFPFTPIIMKLHMQTPHESRMCPIDFEVQRSRSQCINYWKWFPAHNCFPFTPIIMKLHMQTPHETRICPIDFEVKRSKSQCINYWKLFPAHNYFLFTPIIMKLHMQTPHESRMCLEKLSPRGVFVPLGQPRSS